MTKKKLAVSIAAVALAVATILQEVIFQVLRLLM